MSKHGVLREQLLILSKEHPDWRYHQFADYLGKNVNAVKIALNRLGFYVTKQKNYKRVKSRPRKLQYCRDSWDERPEPKLKPRPQHVSIASRATGYSYGYTKLI